MTKEKILAIFDMKIDTPIDKNFMKFFYWFGFCCSVIPIALGYLLKAFPENILELIFVFTSIVLFIVFWLWMKFEKNPAQAYSFCFFVSLLSFLDLAFFSLSFSRLENKPFGLWHILFTIFFTSLGLVINIRKQKALNYLKTHSVEETQKMIQKKRSFMFLLPPAISGALAFPLSRVVSRNVDSGVGLPFWGIASAWLFFVLTTAYSYSLIIKYKVVKIFKENTKTGDSSSF